MTNLERKHLLEKIDGLSASVKETNSRYDSQMARIRAAESCSGLADRGVSELRVENEALMAAFQASRDHIAGLDARVVRLESEIASMQRVMLELARKVREPKNGIAVTAQLRRKTA